MIPEENFQLTQEKDIGVNVLIPRIMIILIAGFILELAFLLTFYQVLLEEGKFVERTPVITMGYDAGIALFGVGYLLLGTLYKRAGKRRILIYIIISVLFLSFMARATYYIIFLQPLQITNFGESGTSGDSHMNYIYFGLLLLIQLVPIVVIGIYLKKYEKKIRLEKESKEISI